MIGDPLRHRPAQATRRVVLEGAGLVALRAFSIGAGIGTVVLLTRLLGPEGYGVYVLTVSCGMALALAIHLGSPTLTLREIAAGLATSDPARVQTAETLSLRLVLGMAALVGGTTAVAAQGLLDPAGRAMAFAAAAIAVAVAFQLRTLSILSGRHRVLAAQVADGLVRPAIVLALLPVLFAVRPQDVDAAIVVYLTGCLGSLAFGIAILSRRRPSEDDDPAATRQRPAQVAARVWLRQLAPFTALGFVGLCQTHADVFALATILPLVEVGKYKVAVLMAAVAGHFHAIVLSMLQPRTAAAWASGDRMQLARLAVTASRVSFGFVLAYALALLAFGGPLIAIAFGPAYADITPVLHILLGAPLAMTLVGSSHTVLNMCGEARLNSALAILGVTIGVTGLWIGAYAYGLAGAAAGTVGSAVFLAVASWWAVSRRIGIRCDVFASVKT